ncbi:uncharacterized protein QC761_116640 [Podospora bellae-mahoneyi]|uniref:SET domain-containing protein n=1 Tax=Podospora bellae-mahoneyi TaxID=2093777 RepID=A0ABR0G0C3_9PEZI|nr:hypothetical protein QC761_116640 [Podospora bellae-mahoneyi]
MGSVATNARGSIDARKSAKITKAQESRPPSDAPAIYVDLIDPDIGYGVFAARDFRKGDFIFHEAPLIDPTDFCELREFNDEHHGPGQMLDLVTALSLADASQMRFAFPKLAAELGKTLPTSQELTGADLNPLLGTRLVHGQLAWPPNELWEKYDKYIKRIREGVVARGGGSKASVEDRVKIAADFFRSHAFQAEIEGNQNPHPAATRPATIYLLASLVNHCCQPPEARRVLKRRTAAKDSPVVAREIPELRLANFLANLKKESENADNTASSSKSPSTGGKAGTSDNNTAIGSGSKNNADDSDAITPAPKTAQESTGTKDFSEHSDPDDGEEEEDNASGSNSLNQRQRGPNCEWRIGPGQLAKFVLPHHIAVKATRDIKAGEELTWDYGKKKQGFSCRCATCRAGTGRSCCYL